MRVCYTKTFVGGTLDGIRYEAQIVRLSGATAQAIIETMRKQETDRTVLTDYTGNAYRIESPEIMIAADDVK